MRIPAFEDLSKEQDRIYNLDLDGNYLVSGPPGTGKSVMALYRAQALSFDDRDPSVLMYSKVLQQYTEQAAEEVEVAGKVTTFHKWFWGFWRQHYGGRPPTLPGNSYEVDWAQVAGLFLTQPPKAGGLADLLVDEGQDLALGFFRIVRFVANNITVFADENQQLWDNNTTLLEIENAIGADEHVSLLRNYRNTFEIAAVAATYYSGAPTGIPEPPERHGDKPTLKRYASSDDFVEFLSRYAKTRSNLQIGVACPNQKLQKRLYRDLAAQKLGIAVQQYVSGNKSHMTLDFDSPSVTLVHYRSLKGLEFDTLFVPELQQFVDDPSSATARMKFYVVTSRAREELHLSWSGPTSTPDIVSHLKGLVEQK